MEPDMALEMLPDLKARDLHVKHLIMDNDSTTLAKAKMSFDPNIQKISDFNHTKKIWQVNSMTSKRRKSILF